ncbi:unnamed protein product [Closterium sp. Yama58-4]|nr:unnamed protein product [Closterium sp. Yama58-4]
MDKAREYQMRSPGYAPYCGDRLQSTATSILVQQISSQHHTGISISQHCTVAHSNAQNRTAAHSTAQDRTEVTMAAQDSARPHKSRRVLIVAWAVISTLLNFILLLQTRDPDTSTGSSVNSESSLQASPPLLNSPLYPRGPVQAPAEAACWHRQRYPASLREAVEGRTDPWALMKAIPPPSPCTVAGLQIEQLEPHLNFRRGYALKHTGDAEDRLHVLPYFRALQDPAMGRRRRRVYLDLGGKEFNSSVLWMLRHYPLDFTEVHVFEVKKGLFLLPGRQKQDDEAQYPEIEPRKRLEKVSVFWRGDDPPPVPNWMADRIHVYTDFVDNSDYHKHVNITRFIKDVLKLTAGDTLVVKMDIEGKEWDVLPDWLQDPDMPHIVDEIFVEVHYSHPSVLGFGWRPFNHTREQATQLLVDLRAKGFFIHPWP